MLLLAVRSSSTAVGSGERVTFVMDGFVLTVKLSGLFWVGLCMLHTYIGIYPCDQPKATDLISLESKIKSYVSTFPTILSHSYIRYVVSWFEYVYLCIHRLMSVVAVAI